MNLVSFNNFAFPLPQLKGIGFPYSYSTKEISLDTLFEVNIPLIVTNGLDPGTPNFCYVIS